MARSRGDNVARTGGAAARHVFSRCDHGDQVDGQLGVYGCLGDPQYGGSTAHVELHFIHRRWWLKGNTAGIKGDALADQGDGSISFLTTVIAQNNHLSRLVAALRDRHEGPHTQAEHLLFIECGKRDILRSRDLTSLAKQIGWCANVGRLVTQILSKGQAGVEGITQFDRRAQGFLIALSCQKPNAL